MMKILPPLSLDDVSSPLFISQDTHMVERITLDAGATENRSLSYRVHESGVHFSLDFFVFLGEGSSFSLDISSFLCGKDVESRLRVFLVLTTQSSAIVRLHTHAPEKSGNVFEEIRGLALGDYKSAQFLPELTLSHDEVLATHAASIVRLRSSDLGYLRARGMAIEDAERCMVDAFLQRK